MAERRSLGDAMEMTPAKLAFIKGETAKETGKDKTKPESDASASEKTIEVEIAPSDPAEPKESRARTSRRTGRRKSAEAALGASELLDQVLVPVTIRLKRRVAQALKRAYLEQQLRNAQPGTQQEIAEEAIADWLVAHGFLE